MNKLNQKQHVEAFTVALQLLTLFPVSLQSIPEKRVQSLSVLYYPVVGLLIGALLFLLSQLISGLPVLLSAAVILLVWVLLTGALHLDGLSDSADGWFAGHRDPSRILQVMRDPHIGSIGVVTLVLHLLLKWVLISTLLENALYTLLLLAPVVGRAAAVLLMVTTPYVRKEGIASDLFEYLSVERTYLILGLVTLFTLLISPLALALGLLAYALIRRAAVNSIGGITGDLAGALIELTELVVLFALLFHL